MVRPQFRSRSIKKVKRRTPGGKLVTHFRKEKTGKPKCGRCTKTIMATERIYGGTLCANCVESLLRYVTRFEAKFHYLEYAEMNIQRDLTIERFLPLNWFKDVSSGKITKKKKKSFKPPAKSKAVKEKKETKKPATKKKAKAKPKVAKKTKKSGK